MATSTTLRLRRDATASFGPEGRVTLMAQFHQVRLGPFSGGVAAAVRALCDAGAGAGAGATEAELAEHVESPADMLAWGKLLGALRAANWLERSVADDEGPLATLRPIALLRAGPATLPEEAPVGLSRFACLRREGESMVMESPRSGSVLVLHRARLAAVPAALASPVTPAELVGKGVTGLDPSEVRATLRLLSEGGFLSAPGAEDGDGAAAGDDAAAAAAVAEWNFVDLLFHARSRLGRHAEPYGGTYRFRGRFDPLPAVKPVTGETVDLRVPDPVPGELQQVIEERVSVREHDGASPITVDQLAELLHRTSRLRGVSATADAGEVASRPYPGGGALYELEVYPVVHQCQGLERGVYRYDGSGHRLERVADADWRMDMLLESLRITAAMTHPPQVALVVTARFGRLMWKYESMAYAAVLKHVGVLYQTLYLVATAMGLAPCALGGGDSDLFGSIAGLRYEAEASVGEFVLGSRPATWTWEVPADHGGLRGSGGSGGSGS